MSVIIVRTEDLPNCPAAFQQYVADWFLPANVLGVDCMKASTLLSWGAEHWGSGGKPKKEGVAPSHSVDLRHYTAGLPPETNLVDWIYSNNKKLVWMLHTPSEPRCCDGDND